MSTNILCDYIEKLLSENYSSCGVLSDSQINHIEVFSKKQSGQKILKIQTYNRNDEVFRILRDLFIPQTPQIFEICSNDDCCVVLEEFIEGKTLFSLLQKKHTLPPETACRYAQDVCKALSVLHSNEIIHRDVKPSNIIITPQDTAVLIDFSIARLKSEEKPKDTLNLGTAGYAAPEMFGISQSTPATDIYALGITLNEMLTGVHPSIDTPNGRLGKIISRCLSMQMSKRFESAEVLSRALSRCNKRIKNE